MTLVSGNIRSCGYSPGVTLSGGLKREWGCDDGNFWRLEWLLFWKIQR